LRNLTSFHPGLLVLGLLLAVASFITFSGCSKDELLTSDGFVVKTDSFAAGGCGYVLLLSTGYYEPNNLPSSFETNQPQLPVSVTYRVLQRTENCPTGDYEGLIHLNRIELR
jgi:hypothetical protein